MTSYLNNNFYRSNIAEEFLQHLEDSVHEDKYHVECPLCDIRVPCNMFAIHYRECALKRKRIVSHLKSVEQRKLEKTDYKCDKCDLTFKSRGRHYVHKKMKHFWGVFKCQTCAEEVNYASDLIDHAVKKGHSLKAICPQRSCNKLFPVSELGGHYEECCTELYKSRNKKHNLKSRSLVLVCDICGKISKAQRDYERHLAAHAMKVKRKKKSTEDGPSSLFCDKCGKEFSHKSQLVQHISYAHGKIVQCEFCNYSCPKLKLGKHMRVHKKASFECGTCGKMLKTKQTLTAHEREHAGIRPFACNVCSKNFSDNAALKQHKRLVHKVAGPNAKPMRRELARGITAFTIDDAIGPPGVTHKTLASSTR